MLKSFNYVVLVESSLDVKVLSSNPNLSISIKHAKLELLNSDFTTWYHITNFIKNAPERSSAIKQYAFERVTQQKGCIGSPVFSTTTYLRSRFSAASRYGPSSNQTKRVQISYTNE